MKQRILIVLSLFLLFTAPELALAQSGVITGKVLTSDGKPAESVTVRLSGKGQGALTGANGEFRISNVKPGSYILRVSGVGLSAQERNITVSGAHTEVSEIILSESSSQLQEVTVSGSKVNKFAVKRSEYVSKMPLKNLENPQVYSVYSKELLAEQQIMKVEDAVKNVPGLHKMWDAVGRAGVGGAFYTLRGFVTSAKLRNGISGNISATIDAANIERLEVIKGPSATLFGSTLTSYGGLINRVTKTPFDSVGGNVTLYGGSYGLKRIAADVNAPLDQEKNILFRLNTAYTSSETFRDNGFSKIFTIAPSLTYIVSDRLSFNLDAEIYSGKGNDFHGVYFYPLGTVAMLGAESADKLNLNYRSSYFNNSLYNTSSNTSLFGQMNLKLSDSWKLQTGISATGSSSNGRTPYFYLVPNQLITRNPADIGANYLARMVWTPVGNDQSVEIQPNLTGDFYIGKFRNRLTVGLDYFGYKSNIAYERFSTDLAGSPTPDLFDIVPLTGPSPTYINFSEDRVAQLYGTRPVVAYSSKAHTNIYSAYAVDVFNITDELMIQAALRIDRFMNKGIYNPQTDTRSKGQYQTAFSPKFGIVYQVVKDRVSLFGNYQNGFTNKTGTDYKGDAFEPEQANQIEGGVKLDAFNGKLSGTLSYYSIKVDNIVRPWEENVQLSIQNGTQESRGFEAEINANPVEGLNIIAGFAYNHSEYTNIDANQNGFRPSTAGPARLANLWMSYRIPYGSFTGFGIAFGGNYASKNYVVNRADQGRFYLPEYTVLNSSLFYDLRKFRVGLSVNNLTNKKYWTGYSTINSQMPRNYTASVSFRF